jgi:beta-ribofuranosylaminobenzene 5'-phosphate synthase
MSDTRALTCRLPARLHFGLLDMNGSHGRVDGGIGLAIREPASVIKVAWSDGLHVCPGNLDDRLRERMAAGLAAVRKDFGLPGAKVEVLARPGAHSGFGSSTQLLVGAARALCLLAGRAVSASDLAFRMRRGGTSGIGTAVLDGGGFVLDGGHRFRRGPRSKQDFAPSGAAAAAPPPVLMQEPFPETWEILIAQPPGLDISGKQELALFHQVCPVPDHEVDAMCRLLLTRIAPAVLEEDLDEFCDGLEAYQRLGFKVAEVGTQLPVVQECMDRLRELDARGIGMSSWGPVVFSFGRDLASLKNDLDPWLAARGGKPAFITRADNHGCRVLL